MNTEITTKDRYVSPESGLLVLSERNLICASKVEDESSDPYWTEDELNSFNW